MYMCECVCMRELLITINTIVLNKLEKKTTKKKEKQKQSNNFKCSDNADACIYKTKSKNNNNDNKGNDSSFSTSLVSLNCWREGMGSESGWWVVWVYLARVPRSWPQ